MTLDLQQLFLLGLLTSTLHWLIARSEIARPLWSRARGFLGKMLACAGCSGFWLGGAAWTAGVRAVPLDARHGGLALHMLLGVFMTPVFEAVLLWGLRESAIVADEPDEEPGSVPQPVAQSNSAMITPNDLPPMRKRP
jgi:hypothetical protein